MQPHERRMKDRQAEICRNEAKVAMNALIDECKVQGDLDCASVVTAATLVLSGTICSFCKVHKVDLMAMVLECVVPALITAAFINDVDASFYDNLMKEAHSQESITSES